MQLLSSRNRLLLPGSSSSSSSSRLLLLPAINRHHGFISTRNTRCLIACARGRRASPDPAQQDEEQHVPLTEQPSSPSPTVVPPLVRSRQGAAAAKRNARGSSLRSVVSPVQTLREKGILDVDESGQSFVNVACLGEGEPRWYALALLENKEDTYTQLLTTKLAENGYSIAPVSFTPQQPPTAAEATTAALAKLQEAAEQAEAAAEDAEAFLQQVVGSPAEAGAAARAAEASAAAAAAVKAVEDLQAAVAAAAVAAESSAGLLQQYDVVVWKPRKKMEVYSHNTDKLVEREVSFSRGTGGATLLLHCALDPTLADVIASTYYFMEWRDFQPVSAVLLNQHDLLPDEAELDAVYKLPEPCAEAFLLQVANWQHTPEQEDLEAERRIYYGTAGGSPFGARPEKGDRADRNNPSNRWSVSAGPTNAGAAALIAAGEPLPWEQEQQEQQEQFGRGRGRGRGRTADGRGGGGRGGRGGQRQWQQQEEQGQYANQPQYAQASGYFQQQQQPQQQGYGNKGSYDDGGWDNSGGGRGRGRGMGRGQGRQQQQQQQPWRQQQQWQPPQQLRGMPVAAAASGDDADYDPTTAEESFSEENRHRQMGWMEELGGSRYRDDDADADAAARPRQQQQRQQRAGQSAAGRDPGPAADDSFGEANRNRQMSWMEDLGGSRYRDDAPEQQQQQQRRPQQQQQQQQRWTDAAANAGGGGGGSGDFDFDLDPAAEDSFSKENRHRQMDWMEELGGRRYRDDDDDVAAAAGAASSSSRRWQQQQQQPPAAGLQGGQQQQRPAAGRDGGTTRMRQLDYMEDMGSGRYSDDEDRYNYDKLEGLDGRQQQQQQQGRQQQQGQQGQQQRPAGGGRDKGATMASQLNFMADMGSDRYSDDEDDNAAAAAGGRRGGGSAGSRSSSGNFSSLLSEVADAFDYMETGGGAFPASFAAEPSSSSGGPTARNNAAGGWGGKGGFASNNNKQNPGSASYMDEDTMEWAAGDDYAAADDDDGGAAAAKAMLQEWQSEGLSSNLNKAAAGGQPGGRGGLNPYNAELSTRSQEGLGASFDFDAGPGLASADSLLGQLPADLGALEAWGPQQQQQQPLEQQQPPPPAEAAAAPKRKSRAGTSSRRSTKKTEGAAADGAAGATTTTTGRRKAAGSGRKAASTKEQQGAEGVGDVPLDGWVGGADVADEGFEEGWVDRMMGDGNDRVGLDDVMRS